MFFVFTSNEVEICVSHLCFQSPHKTPTKSPSKHGEAVLGNTTPRSPRTPSTQGLPKTSPYFRANVFSVAESPAAGTSYERSTVLRGGPFRSPVRRTLLAETPTKQSPVRSPLKGILRTPTKAMVECEPSSGSRLLSSPTPKKNVTWSPSPQKLRLVEKNPTFKVPESPLAVARRSPRLNTPDKFNSPVRNANTKRDIFKTPERTRARHDRPMSVVNLSENKGQRSLEKLYGKNKTPEKEDSDVLMHWPLTPPPYCHISPRKTQNKTPSPTCQMSTRSGRTPCKNSALSFQPLYSPVVQSTVSERPDTSIKSPKMTQRKSLRPSTKTTRRSLSSLSNENVPSVLKNDDAETCGLHRTDLKRTKTIEREQPELSHSSETDSSSQLCDSSHFSSVTTDDESIDIVDAEVVKTQFSGGLKMNISFSRKSSKSGEDLLLNTASPKHLLGTHGTPGRNYGFRQTPDRQQREAAARLGYGSDSPRFSSPRGPARPCKRKDTGTASPMSYQVELEMRKAGLPKLKIKRADSMNAGELASDGGTHSPSVNAKSSQRESPLVFLSKHRDPVCVSPSICAHATPAKGTPGKGGSVQTYICQSYTPTRHGGTVSPVATADIIPLTPSPQSAGKVTPDNLNSWPRKKRARVGGVGSRDRVLKGDSQLEELLEEAELGVSRLIDSEDNDELTSNKAAVLAAADGSPVSSMGDWVVKLARHPNSNELQRVEEDMNWATEDIKLGRSWVSYSAQLVRISFLFVFSTQKDWFESHFVQILDLLMFRSTLNMKFCDSRLLT